jgi:RNA polymerase sigma-70 factor (ECF subfamily)
LWYQASISVAHNSVIALLRASRQAFGDAHSKNDVAQQANGMAANERALIERIRRFDTTALTEVYDTYNRAVFRYAYRLLGDTALADDCTTETFSRLLKALRDGSGPDAYLKAYLFRVAHNWAADHYRAGKRMSSLDQMMEDDGFELVDDQPTLLAVIDASIQAETVRTTLNTLTSDQRMVIVMKFYEEMSNDEVAEALGKPLTAVKALQHRALGALRRALAEHKSIMAEAAK